jgi:hypothetical protein
MVAGIADRQGRIEEQREHLKRALDWLLSRIERGVTIQVRFLPPPATSSREGEPPDIPQEFKTLQTIAPQLVFPKMEGPPIFQLPDQDNNKCE